MCAAPPDHLGSILGLLHPNPITPSLLGGLSNKNTFGFGFAPSALELAPPPPLATPATRSVRIFISHAWKHDDDYRKLGDWITCHPVYHNGLMINFVSNSVPKDKPLIGVADDAEIARALFDKIRGSDIVVGLTAMYSAHSEWIDFEHRIAFCLRKPILAVRPNGQRRNATNIQRYSSGEIVGWRRDSVIQGILSRLPKVG